MTGLEIAGIIGWILLVFVTLWALRCRSSVTWANRIRSNSESTVPETAYPELNDDHEAMIATLDQLENQASAHFDREETLFRENKKKMPAEHVKVDVMWTTHQKQHQHFLASIEKMKKDLIHHIETQDQPHFHFGQR